MGLFDFLGDIVKEVATQSAEELRRQRREQEERENNLGQILATILVKNFRPFLDPEDYNDMKDKLGQLEHATDKFQKDSLNNDLAGIANQYGILLNIFLFKIISNNAKNPQDAARANCAFDEMMQALKAGDIPAIRRIQDENSDLLQRNDTGIGDFSVALG